jgi:hypothetical protein
MKCPLLSKQPHSQVGAQAVSLTAQRVAKSVITQNIRKRAGSPLATREGPAIGAVVATGVTSMVDSLTEEELAETEADSKWMEGLQVSVTGKKLCDYLGHVTSVLDDGNLGVECPIDQACSFRRVLVKALESRESPFGLPKKLPNFIAMVQLCGERMLLTTERSQLFQLLAHAPSGARSNSNAINSMAQMIKYQKDHPECSLLLTYSAPFQVDLKDLWWDVRTIRRDPTSLGVIDGELAYQVHEQKPRTVGCTSASESVSAMPTLEKEVRAYEARVAAVDLDTELFESAAAQPGQNMEKRVETLEAILGKMQAARKRTMEEHKAEVERLQKAESMATMAATEAAKMAAEADRESQASLNREINRLAKECEASINAVGAQKRQNELLRKEHRSEQNAKAMEMAGEIDTLRAAKVQLEKDLKSSQEEFKKVEKKNSASTRKLETGHQKSLDEMERKLGKLQMAERTARQEAEDLMGRLSSLSTAMEGRDSEKELLQHELKKAVAAKRVFKGFLALAGARHELTSSTGEQSALVATLKQLDEANSRIKLHELSAGAMSVEVKKLQDTVGERELARDQLGEANARLQARLEELEAPTKPAMADVETMTVPITNTADLKIGELETENVKLKDELEAKQNECVTLKAELQRAKQKASRKAVPPGLVPDEPGKPVVGTPAASGQSGTGYNIVTNVHVGNGGAGNSTAVASTDLGHASDVDASVEHIIASAANQLRVLADMARDSSRHKAAAHEGWSRAQALQNFTGYQMPQQQWMQAMQPMPHSPNGYHAM